ncbi:DedA family protein [Propionibacteriaceae bacterium Y1700]|uniref:DedA family protein n=1 Tax=Microlunatus sp. Y1700 TaxID=3418487 RepID=UPI003DA6D8A7
MTFLDPIITWLVDLMSVIGAPGAGIAIALENLFPPIPSEAILPLAGFAAAQGRIGLVEAILWTTAGSVVGALVLYALGALVGAPRLRKVVDWLPLMDADDFDRTLAWFERHGGKAVLFGRMVPIFRSLISIPAGVARMSLPSFVLLTTIGSLIWNTIFVLAGYLLGANWHVMEQYADVFQKIVIVAVLLAAAVFVVRRVRSRRRRTPADA